MSIITVGAAKEEHHHVLVKSTLPKGVPAVIVAPPPLPPAEVTSGWHFYRKPMFKISLAGIALALGIAADTEKKTKK